MRPFLLHSGYQAVAPKFGDERKKLLVHRLVATAFVSGYFAEATVNHIDGVKTNNRADNLEWLTLADNTAHQWKIGLVDIRGEKHPSSKLSDDDVRSIRARAVDSVTALAREFRVSKSLIYKIRQGRKKEWLI